MKSAGLRNSEIRYQYSARDAISRWDCSLAFRRASSFTAAIFLEYMEKKFPFPVRAIQIDGGSEFKKHFEAACRDRRIRLFIIPPRSPKLQGYVERSNRTHREEFYEVEEIAMQFKKLQSSLSAFEDLALRTEHFEKAAEFSNVCRKAGVQGSSIDFLLCAVAAKETWPIFTTDRDFDIYRRHLPIRIV